MHQNNQLQLFELIKSFMNYLEGQGYALSTRKHLKAYCIQLLKYTECYGIQYYSLETGKAFLLDKYGFKCTMAKLSAHQNFLQRLVTMLAEFQEHGKVITKRRCKRKYSIPHFLHIVDGYLDHKRSKGLRQSTLSGQRHSLNQIFEYLESIGLQNSKDISVSSIYGFLESRSYFSLATKERYQYLLRDIIKYMHNNGLCRSDLRKLFPVISVHTKNAYPSYFKPNDISKILDSVDTNTKTGKRDYLILLLAAQLGMRVGDIRSLKMDSINFAQRQVEYIQLKTGDSVYLPMNDELFYAIIDYLKNARPNSDSKEVFINIRAPKEPFSSGNHFHGMLAKYLSAAGIMIDDGQKHGLHSLRSSLASNMLRDGVSMPVISNVLGHKYYDTTNIYLKIDLHGLRKIALEVPVL